MIAGEVHYCPECTWNVYTVLWPGNNGFVERQYCSFCGWFGQVGKE